MKKIITLLLAGLLCVTAAACSGTQETAKTDDASTADSAAQITEPDDLVVSEKYFNVYAVSQTGEKEDPIDYTYEYEFDGEGHPTKTTTKTNGKVESVKEMEIDAAGNVVKETVFDSDGNKTTVSEFEYDGNNNTKRILYNAEGKVSSELTHEYDENGYLISDSYRSDDYSYTIKYENDRDGKLLSSVQYDGTGSEVYKVECEYDSDGHLIREMRSYDAGSGMSGSSKVEYEYDDRGNAVKEVSYDADGNILYSYDRVYKTVKELSDK